MAMHNDFMIRHLQCNMLFYFLLPQVETLSRLHYPIESMLINNIQTILNRTAPSNAETSKEVVSPVEKVAAAAVYWLKVTGMA